MKKVAWSLAVPIRALCWQASAQSFQSSFSFQYRLDISVHATVMQVGLRFQGAQFVPTMGTPFGHMEFPGRHHDIASFDCFGNLSARDRIPFFTPPPQVVTVEQWEQVTVSRRTVKIGYW